MNKNFEFELPEGYKEVKVIDAKDKKTSIIFALLTTVIAFALIAIFEFIIIKINGIDDINESLLLALFIYLIAYVVYIVLHELTHGLAYKLLTKQKLTFGLTLTVAYCGVPNIYVYRKASMIAMLAPFVVFTFVLGIPMLFVKSFAIFTLFNLLFSCHLAGCVGDIYGTLVFLFKVRDKNALVKDTGPKQTFYIKEE